MSLEEGRDLLWDAVKDMNDEELEDFIAQCKRFVSLIVDFAEQEVS